MPSDRLAGKIAIVTGASRGIGLATTETFLEEGARVALVARPSAHFERECARLADRFDVLALDADVRNSAECAAAVEATVARWGRIDAMFNNAGISFVARIDELTDDQWQLAFGTNVAGQFWFAREVSRRMMQRRSRAIVNMASELAFQGQTGHATQSATKGASLAFTRSLAADLAPFGVRVNASAPAASTRTTS